MSIISWNDPLVIFKNCFLYFFFHSVEFTAIINDVRNCCESLLEENRVSVLRVGNYPEKYWFLFFFVVRIKCSWSSVHILHYFVFLFYLVTQTAAISGEEKHNIIRPGFLGYKIFEFLAIEFDQSIFRF